MVNSTREEFAETHLIADRAVWIRGHYGDTQYFTKSENSNLGKIAMISRQALTTDR